MLSTDQVKTLSSVALSLGLSCAAEASPWRAIAPLPTPASGFGVGTVDGRLVVAGGTTVDDANAKRWLADAWTLEGDRWATRVAALPHAVAYPAAAVVGDRLWLLGGSDEKAVRRDAIGLGSTNARTSALAAPLQFAAVGVAPDGRVVLAGGMSDAADFTTMTDRAQRIDPATGVGEPLPAIPGGAFILAASAATRDALFVFGGATLTPAAATQPTSAAAIRNRDDAYAFDFGKNAWRRLRPLPAARRGLAAVALDDAHVLIVGGYGRDAGESADRFRDHAWVYSIADDAYRAVAPLPYAAMGVGLARVGDQVFAFGGEDRQRHRTAAAFACELKSLLHAAVAE